MRKGIGLIVAACVLTGCSGSSKVNAVNASVIVGEWTATLTDSTTTSTFRPDGTYRMTVDVHIKPIPELKDAKLPVFDNMRDTEEGSYTLNNDILTCTPTKASRDTLDSSGNIKSSEAEKSPKATQFRVADATETSMTLFHSKYPDIPMKFTRTAP